MSRYLDMVDSPVHVKKLTLPQLQQLAEEIRYELITVLSRNGGHLGPNLGVVELTLALHRVFETPKDSFVWDVSHQVYVHKLLTGRKDRFHTIRTTDGLNGFALRSESEHDCYGAGHAGTALSAALGMCAARDKLGGKEHVVCIFGDAALTNGISFEALNNLSTTTRRFIGILNDNEWSIAKNVGAISNYLARLTTDRRYNKLAQDFAQWIRRMPTGKLALKLGHKAEEFVKGALADISLKQSAPTPDTDGKGGYGSVVLFEEMGVRYLGPIDGHDLPLLINTLEFAKTFEEPIVIHVLTKKGKGYDAAQKAPEKFHGLGPYDIQTGTALRPKRGTPPNYQDVVGDTLVKLCKKDKRLVGITAAMPSGTGLKKLADKLPDRYFDVGIAEEHAVIFAAGMATKGLHPFVTIYSTFLQRAYDCIHHDVCLQNLPVAFCMDRAGLSANDGPTHHGLFDIAYLRCLPNVVGMAPADEDELQDMMYTASLEKCACFIRYPRGSAEGVAIKEDPVAIEVGKGTVVKPFVDNGGPKIALFGLGNMLNVARETAERLTAEGHDVAILNPRFYKPLDAALHEFYGNSADVVATLEDHVLMGGYGAAVLELFAEHEVKTPVVRLGWPDKFIEHASSVNILRERHGVTSAALAEKIMAALGGEAVQHPQRLAMA